MTDKGRPTVVILLGILVLFSLSLTTAGFYLLQKERGRNLSLQEELEDIKAKQRVAEARAEDLKKMVSGLQLKLQEDKMQIDTLNQDLQQEKAMKTEALNKIEQLRADLDNQKELRSDLESKLTRAEGDLKKMQGELNDLEAKRTQLETNLKDMEAQGVELGEIVVTPESAAASETAVKPIKKEAFSANAEGKVLVVNKDYNFVVINLGNKEGVRVGNLFSLYHNNQYVGDVKVEKVHDAMSAAGFVSEDIKDKISEGDRVVPKSK
jgi:predicted RNase H-like nuclease (RuvC/YqgF family)